MRRRNSGDSGNWMRLRCTSIDGRPCASTTASTWNRPSASALLWTRAFQPGSPSTKALMDAVPTPARAAGDGVTLRLAMPSSSRAIAVSVDSRASARSRRVMLRSTLALGAGVQHGYLGPGTAGSGSGSRESGIGNRESGVGSRRSEIGDRAPEIQDVDGSGGLSQPAERGGEHVSSPPNPEADAEPDVGRSCDVGTAARDVTRRA